MRKILSCVALTLTFLLPLSAAHAQQAPTQQPAAAPPVAAAVAVAPTENPVPTPPHLTQTAPAATNTLPIGVVDVARLVSESDAGKSIIAQLNARSRALNDEAKSIEASLLKEQSAIAAQQSSLKPQEFQAKAKEFDAKIAANRDNLIKKNAALETARLTALKQLQQYIAKISANIAEKKGLRLILDRAAVVIVEQGIDVTADALQQLNASVKSVKVGG